MHTGYKEPAYSVVTRFTEKKSRFITNIAAVRREDEAKAFIERIKQKYPDATHNCTAYRLWYPRIERFSDDGEPAGTAGMPMLEVMKKEDVYNICAVVTRYFGGVLLGGGGLIRAYSRGVSEAINESGFAVRLESVTLLLMFEYNGYSIVDRFLDNTVHNRVSCSFNQKVELTISVRSLERASIEQKLRDLLRGNIEIREISSGFDSFK